jgi:hypothetical protein
MRVHGFNAIGGRPSSACGQEIFPGDARDLRAAWACGQGPGAVGLRCGAAF